MKLLLLGSSERFFRALFRSAISIVIVLRMALYSSIIYPAVFLLIPWRGVVYLLEVPTAEDDSVEDFASVTDPFRLNQFDDHTLAAGPYHF